MKARWPERAIPLLRRQSDAGTKYAAQHDDYNSGRASAENKPTPWPQRRRLSPQTKETGSGLLRRSVLTWSSRRGDGRGRLRKGQQYKGRHRPRGARIPRRARAKTTRARTSYAQPNSPRLCWARTRCPPTKASWSDPPMPASHACSRALRWCGSARRLSLRRFRHRHGADSHPVSCAEALPRQTMQAAPSAGPASNGGGR